jgi:hypothetical protein
MPLLLLMWATAWLLLVSSFHHNHVSAAVTQDQIEAVEKILLEMEDKVKALGNEVKNAYEKRCHPDTYERCLYNNYHDCSSKYPNQICIKDRFNTSGCEVDGGSSCNGEFVGR